MITLIRIYPTNHFTRFRTQRVDQVPKWIDYNKRTRSVAALIVDGEVVFKGQLTDEQIAVRVAQINQKPHYPWTEDPLRQGGSEECV